jgi:hypothetical protein
VPIVALAFHEHLALEKIERYFASGQAASGEARAISCPKCSLSFGVVLVNHNDKKNEKYLIDLRTLVAEDCINGLHKDEYVLTS